jgi:phosphoribosylaminoimidazolecarboxamide formyltransferase/IMP cyclohydrolase
LSAFGGIVALNRTLDLPTAEAIAATFFEVVLAPDFAPEALARLQRKKALRLLEVGEMGREPEGGPDLKRIRGGYLITDWDSASEAGGEVVTRRAPTDDERAAMAFGWRLAKHVRSNAIVLAGRDQAVGVGAGQMSRVDAVRLAVDKAQLPVGGTSMASDAFFPFRDGLDAAVDAGVTAVIQPGGSVRDAEVIAAADERGVAMIFTGVRHFKH